jgi:vancomycin resistance protein VanW
MLRQLARRYLPYELRLRVRLGRRAFEDRRNKLRFASTRGTESDYPHLVCSYERPLVNYPGQEHVLAAKQQNLDLLASCLSGVVIRPGEVFSIWHLAGRPTADRGYAPAAAFKNRGLAFDIGGSTCLMSTVLYNIGLLGALEIVERHCHSIDLYGEDRYFDLGRDASIEYGYLDLRFRNPHSFPVLLDVERSGGLVRGRLSSPCPHGFTVTLAIDSPRGPAEAGSGADEPEIVVSGRRTVKFAGGSEYREELPVSAHYRVRDAAEIA